jgi:hypothetical protein
MRTALILVAILSAAASMEIRSEELPTLSIRYMTIEADVIVIAVPVVPELRSLPVKFKVAGVLKGPASLDGQEVVLRNEGLYVFTIPDRMRAKDDKTPLPRIAKALLFLKNPPKETPTAGYGTVLSGIRALTETGDLLVPQQMMNPGPLYLRPMKGQVWTDMLVQIQKDLPTISQILELQGIAGLAKRNQAIFTWVDSHKNELGGYCLFESKGWGPLEQKLLGWIMDSCIPEDCWRAIELAVELKIERNRNAPSFCSPAGRQLLANKALNPKLPNALRLAALDELGNEQAFWSAYCDEHPGTRVATRDEQKMILERFSPMIDDKDAAFRLAAVRCLQAASYPGDANFDRMISKQAVPALVKRYHCERNTEVRDEIVHALRYIEDEAFWQKLTGNPAGIVVFLQEPHIKPNVLEFDMNLEHTRAKIMSVPSFRCEKLQPDGSVSQTQTIKATISYPKNLFTRGWENADMVTMTMPSSQLEPGNWCVTLEGRWKGQMWRSESLEVSIPGKKGKQ